MKYGVQLYSLRRYLGSEEGYERVFEAVKRMGAQVVQVSATGARPIAASRLKELSERHALPICVTHSPFERITGDTEKLAEEHLLFGCASIGIGMMPGAFRKDGPEGIRRFVDVLNDLSRRLERFGVSIAYHNHRFELAEPGESGKTIYDQLIEGTDPAVRFIPDTFWIRAAGADINAYLGKLRGRVDTLHLKDYRETLGVPIFRAIGKGVLDFPGILERAGEAGAANCVVELDYSPNPMKSMRESLARLRSLTTKGGEPIWNER